MIKDKREVGLVFSLPELYCIVPPKRVIFEEEQKYMRCFYLYLFLCVGRCLCMYKGSLRRVGISGVTLTVLFAAVGKPFGCCAASCFTFSSVRVFMACYRHFVLPSFSLYSSIFVVLLWCYCRSFFLSEN